MSDLKSNAKSYIFLACNSIFQVAETFTFTLDELDHHDHDHGHNHQANLIAQIPMLKDHARLDNCVTVIDAVNFDATFKTGDYLSDRFEASGENDDRTVVHLMIDQIEFANFIVLNKVDLVEPEVLGRIRNTLKRLNPVAEIYPTNYSNVPLSKILNTHQFNFFKAAQSSGWMQQLRGAEIVPETEEYGISSFIYHKHRPFVPRKLYDLMKNNFLLQVRTDGKKVEEKQFLGDSVKDGIAARSAGPFANVLRSKGFMWSATRPFNMQEWSQAGAILVLQNAGPWFWSLDPSEWIGYDESVIKKKFSEDKDIGDRRNEIVFIGSFDENDRDEIKRALDSCLVTDEQFRTIIKEGFDPTIQSDDPFVNWFSTFVM